MTKPPQHDRPAGAVDGADAVYAGLEREARVDRVAPLADAAADRPLTEDERADGVRVAETFLRSPGMTAAGFAKMLGVAPGTLRAVLAGQYRGDMDGILRRVRPTVNAWFRAKGAPERGGFVRGAVARKISTALRYVTARGGMGILYGASGIGKSFTLRSLVTIDYPTALYLEVSDDSRTTKNLYKSLAGKLRVRGVPTTASRAVLFSLLVERLSESRRMLVIDEADGLDLAAFNGLRQLHDQTGSPVVLAGRPNLERRIEATRRRDEIGASVAGRLILRMHLGETTEGSDGGPGEWICSVGEMAMMLKRYQVLFEAEAIRWLCSLAHLTAIRGAMEEGGLRLALNVAELAATAARDRVVTVTLCRAALQLLRGAEGAAQLGDELRRTVRRAPGMAAVG